jgi:DNA-binding response OmpR family regulator
MQLDTSYDTKDVGVNNEAGHGSPANAWRWSGPHIHEAAADHEPGENAVLRVHDMEIDSRTRTVKRGGRVIALTPYEFSLLWFLASRPGQIVTRDQIRENLYKHNEHRSNVIDAHICYLRNKIDRGFNLPLILTRWRAGYIFRAEEQRPGDRAQEAAHADICW